MKTAFMLLFLAGVTFAQNGTACDPGWKPTASGGCEKVYDAHAEIVTRVEGRYTKKARAAHIQGTVVVEIGIDGLPHNIQVLKPLDPGLDHQAIDALYQWRFKPALMNGQPVASEAEIKMNFSLGLKPPVVASSCPVSITKLESGMSTRAALAEALAQAGTSATYLQIYYQNNTDKQIDGIRFTAMYSNVVREPFHSVSLTTISGTTLKAHKLGRLMQADGHITSGQKLAVTGWVEKVLFADGTMWTDDGRKACSVNR